MITTSALPAAASSLIPPVLTQRRDAAPLGLDECPGLLERLAVVPDPRDRRGRRHPQVTRRHRRWLGGRSHSETEVGSIVWLITASSSAVSVSRSTCARRRTLNAWMVLAAS